MRFAILIIVSLVSLTAHAAQNSPPSEMIFKTLNLDLVEAKTPGAKLYQSLCSHCHVLPHPTLHTMEQWPAVLLRMRSNSLQLGQPAPSQTEIDDILKFLGDYLKNTKSLDPNN